MHGPVPAVPKGRASLKPFESLTIRGQIRRLHNAYVCCKECGLKYGVYSVGCSSTWAGKCDVCGRKKLVTETRDYAYLVTGKRRLWALLEASKGATVNQSPQDTHELAPN